MNARETLTNARSREIPWPLIVEALYELTKAGSIDKQGRPWIEVAAQLTGYTTNQLRAGQRTFTSIKNFIQVHALPNHALGWQMSNLEVITRIVKTNPEKAKEIIGSNKQRTLRDLRDLYDQVRGEAGSKISPMSASHQSVKLFTKSLFEKLSNKHELREILGLQQNTPLGALKLWPGRYPFAHPNFYVAFSIDGKLQIAAFEGLKFYGDVTSKFATLAALRAAVEATFFSRYYWCAPSWMPIEDLKVLRVKLGLSNVGILSIGADNIKNITCPIGPAIHDRQDIILKDSSIYDRLRIDL